jgi:hypothetical protein
VGKGARPGGRGARVGLRAGARLWKRRQQQHVVVGERRAARRPLRERRGRLLVARPPSETIREERDRKKRRENARRREVDRILDKISAEGYDALSDDEKRTLEDAGSD